MQLPVRQGIDISTSMGEMIFQFVGILSSWEREMIRERTLARLERAKSEGKTLGRKSVINDETTPRSSNHGMRRSLFVQSRLRLELVEERRLTSSTQHE